MKIYNYQFLTPNSNATLCITVRTDKGESVADFIAHDELALALNASPADWYVEEITEEDY